MDLYIIIVKTWNTLQGLSSLGENMSKPTPVQCITCTLLDYALWFTKSSAYMAVFFKEKRVYLLCKYKVSTNKSKMSRNADTTPRIIPVKERTNDNVFNGYFFILEGYDMCFI